MKSLYSFLVLTLLSSGVSMAQQSTGVSPTTKPASTTSTSTNRQQELYDQYHGITKKPATSAPAATPAPVPRENTKRQPSEPVATQPTIDSRPERIASGSSNMSGTRIGIRGGITRSIYTETITGIDPTLGFVGGVTFNIGGGTFSFQPEINYTRYSAKVALPGFTQTNAADVLEIPLFLKISSGTYAGNRFFVNVGPYATYLASISVDGKKESLNGANGRFGFGAAAGVGAALKTGPGHVTIEVRGLYPLGDFENGFNTDSDIIFGQVAVGYVFPLGGR